MITRFITPQDIDMRGVTGGAVPCMTGAEIQSLFGERSRLTALDVLNVQMSAQRRLWTTLHSSLLSPMELMLCALEFARDALSRYGETLPSLTIFNNALSVYEAWLCNTATTEDRDVAHQLAMATARELMRSIPRSPELATAWAVAYAGSTRTYEAARASAFYARRADNNSPKVAHRQVAMVIDILNEKRADRFKRDVAASEAHTNPESPMPMDNSLSCNVLVVNNTNNALQNGAVTADHGNTYFLADSIPANSGQVSAVQGVGVTCAEFGTKGTANYTFGNAQSLMFLWNIPYTYSGMGDGILPYFYAVLQGTQPGQYQVSITNVDALYMCQQPPQADSSGYVTQMSPIVTLSAL
ncbi:MAG: hypothetical protein ABI644_09240 [Arenimonas sp.]